MNTKSKIKSAFITSAACFLFSISSQAQISVTTIGANDAVLCSQNAFDTSSDLDPCNKALRKGNLSKLDKARTLVNRGVIFNFRFEPQNAIDDFDAALEIDPNIGEAYANRGSSYFLGGLYDRALNDYNRALELDANMAWATWYNIGLLYLETKQPEDARSAFRKSLSLKPDFAPALNKVSNL